ncbi:MAG TPA: hypothetical protein EYO73_09975 [Sulfurimonas sp.]|nr:hypothetical protein [Sulfurimonas sp.]
MSDFIYYLMTNFTNQIVFLHVFSAVIWVGAMASSRYVRVKPLKSLTQPEEFIFETQRYTKFFKLMTPFIVILFITALIMALNFHDNAYDSDGFIYSNQAIELLKLVHTKGGIWIVMAMNMGLMAWINYKVSKNLKMCSNVIGCERCKEALEIIYNYLMPVNIILGTIEIMFGVVLRHAY